MQNFELLKAAGAVNKPILLKRGLAATIEEFINAAEYIMAQGNGQIILCERGIRTYERATRNTLDISAVPILKKETHLPVLVDVTHSTGRRDLLLPAAKAALAIGADGVMAEVHPDPAVALSDNAQQMDLKRALSEAGIEYNEDLVSEGDYTYDSGIEAFEKLNELDNKPTAIFVGSDEMALGVVHGAEDKGFVIPDDFEVITSDNTRLSLMVRPQLTTVVQPLYDIGAVAMRLLTKLMNKEEVSDQKVILPHRIEKRSSTK